MSVLAVLSEDAVAGLERELTVASIGKHGRAPEALPMLILRLDQAADVFVHDRRSHERKWHSGAEKLRQIERVEELSVELLAHLKRLQQMRVRADEPDHLFLRHDLKTLVEALGSTHLLFRTEACYAVESERNPPLRVRPRANEDVSARHFLQACLKVWQQVGGAVRFSVDPVDGAVQGPLLRFLTAAMRDAYRSVGEDLPSPHALRQASRKLLSMASKERKF